MFNISKPISELNSRYLGIVFFNCALQISSSAEVLPSQISEEKIVFGLNAVAVSQMTLSKMKRIYSKVITVGHFDKRLGAVHYVRWSKFSFSMCFAQKAEKWKKQQENLAKNLIFEIAPERWSWDLFVLFITKNRVLFRKRSFFSGD